MSASPPLDSLGRRRSPAALPGYLTGRRPRSKGRRYPADPPRTEEIVAVMRCCGDGHHGDRARGLIVVVLWRAGLRIQEALDLAELDLDARRGSGLDGVIAALVNRCTAAPGASDEVGVRHHRRGARDAQGFSSGRAAPLRALVEREMEPARADLAARPRVLP